MKLLLENWREYNRLNEKVNSLDPDSGKRFIGNLLLEVAESDNLILIPEKEMAAIRKWGNLEGEASFLGSGSRGSAYQFGDKVLKFTYDGSEVDAAASLMGEVHPNVYDIYAVAKRTVTNRKDSDSKFRTAVYVIVYGFLDYPTNAMIEVAQLLNEKIHSSGREIFYRWEDSNLGEARDLMREFVRSIKEDPTLLGEPSEKIENMLPKIRGVAESLGWDDKQHKLFEILWTLIGGAWGQHSDSPEEAEEYTLKIIDDSRLVYFHQLALGLTFLKSIGVIFSDLKTTNIMQKNGQVAIIDVGKSIVEGNPEIPEIKQ